MRVSWVFALSPRQYAPASEVSLTALIGALVCRCGPRHRSVNAPCVYSEIPPSAVPTSSTLYGCSSASNRSTAASAETSSRDQARPSASRRPISVSIAIEVVVADRLGELEVVVEAVVDRRADRDLHVRVQAQHGLGEQMGARVPEDVERVRVGRVAGREDLDGRAVRERQPQVLGRTVRADEDGLLGELRPDRAGGIEPAGAVRQLERGSVGEDDVHASRIVTLHRLPRSRLSALRPGDDADGVHVRCPHLRTRERPCVRRRPGRDGGRA